jgi:hypothetical protein
MRFATHEKHALTHSPRIMMAVEQWLDGEIGIQDFIDLTGCSTLSFLRAMEDAEDHELVVIDTVDDNVRQPWHAELARSFTPPRVPQPRQVLELSGGLDYLQSHALRCAGVVAADVRPNVPEVADAFTHPA